MQKGGVLFSVLFNLGMRFHCVSSTFSRLVAHCGQLGWGLASLVLGELFGNFCMVLYVWKLPPCHLSFTIILEI